VDHIKTTTITFPSSPELALKFHKLQGQ